MMILLSQIWTNLRIARDRRRLAEVLSRLSDVHLRDIGIERLAIETYVEDGLPWQTRKAYPVHAARTSVQGCG